MVTAREEVKSLTRRRAEGRSTVLTDYLLRDGMIDRFEGLAVSKACPDSGLREDGRCRRSADSSRASPGTGRSFTKSLGRFKSNRDALSKVGEELGVASSEDADGDNDNQDGAQLLSRVMMAGMMNQHDNQKDDNDAIQEFACLLRDLSQRIFASNGREGAPADFKELRVLSPNLFQFLFLLFVRDGIRAALQHYHSKGHLFLSFMDAMYDPSKIPGDEKDFKDRFFEGGKPTPDERWQFTQSVSWPYSRTGEGIDPAGKIMPTLCVKRVGDPVNRHADTGSKTKGQQCGLFAGEDIEAGVNLTGYGGIAMCPGKVAKDSVLKDTVCRRLLLACSVSIFVLALGVQRFMGSAIACILDLLREDLNRVS